MDLQDVVRIARMYGSRRVAFIPKTEVSLEAQSLPTGRGQPIRSVTLSRIGQFGDDAKVRIVLIASRRNGLLVGRHVNAAIKHADVELSVLTATRDVMNIGCRAPFRRANRAERNIGSELRCDELLVELEPRQVPFSRQCSKGKHRGDASKSEKSVHCILPLARRPHDGSLYHRTSPV